MLTWNTYVSCCRFCQGQLSSEAVYLTPVQRAIFPHKKRLFLRAIDVGNHVKTASTFTDIVADRVQTLFRQAPVLIVEVRLSAYGPVQLSDESDDLRQAIQGVERFLRARLRSEERRVGKEDKSRR